jgi:cobalt-precorrin-5B (C1)-methyltransferase
LGIIGGLSILGTTGIVDPMSEQALVDSFIVHIRQMRALGHDALVVTPGNFGEAFLAREAAALGPYTIVCSNFIGAAFDSAASEGFSSVLIAGHAGKLTKVACNMLDTHSKHGDPRIEAVMAHAALKGAPQSIMRELSVCATTDACMDVLRMQGLEMDTTRSLVGKVSEHLLYRVGNRMQVGVLMFWGRPNRSVMDEDARMIIERICKEVGNA